MLKLMQYVTVYKNIRFVVLQTSASKKMLILCVKDITCLSVKYSLLAAM